MKKPTITLTLIIFLVTTLSVATLSLRGVAEGNSEAISVLAVKAASGQIEREEMQPLEQLFGKVEQFEQRMRTLCLGLRGQDPKAGDPKEQMTRSSQYYRRNREKWDKDYGRMLNNAERLGVRIDANVRIPTYSQGTIPYELINAPGPIMSRVQGINKEVAEVAKKAAMLKKRIRARLRRLRSEARKRRPETVKKVRQEAPEPIVVDAPKPNQTAKISDPRASLTDSIEALDDPGQREEATTKLCALRWDPDAVLFLLDYIKDGGPDTSKAAKRVLIAWGANNVAIRESCNLLIDAKVSLEAKRCILTIYNRWGEDRILNRLLVTRVLGNTDSVTEKLLVQFLTPYVHNRGLRYQVVKALTVEDRREAARAMLINAGEHPATRKLLEKEKKQADKFTLVAIEEILEHWDGLIESEPKRSISTGAAP